MESNLSAHLTPEIWGTVMKVLEASTGGDPTKMETPKTLQEGCATSLVAALDLSIAGTLALFCIECCAALIYLGLWSLAFERSLY